MRFALLLLCFLLGPVSVSHAQLSIGIGLPGVNIGINLPLYPELVRVPGYPVYYAPRLNSNFFFYDGMYWVYQGDNWYASSWYNGPWGIVEPEVVPLFVLRIPVRYYRNPPGYFRVWRADAPPRWGDHWGNDWQQRRSGWDQWNRNAVPAPAPLPVYQRQYAGNRYPQQDRQHQLQTQHYRYQPREAVVRQHFQEQARAPAPGQRAQQGGPQDRNPRPQEAPRTPQSPHQQAPAAQPRPQPGLAQQQPRGGEDLKRSAPGSAAQEPREQPRPAPVQREQARQAPLPREQPAPRPQQERAPQGKDSSQDERRRQGAQGQQQNKGHDRDKSDERGQDRNR